MSALLPARPGVEPPRPWEFPVPETQRLANGLSVLQYHVPGQHIVSARLAIPAPLAGEPVGGEGLGGLMARTLDEGTQRRSAEEMLELLERKGVALSADIGERGLTVAADVPAWRLGEALELLREVVQEPAFDEAEVRRHVRARLAELDQEQAVPAQRAHREFTRAYYAASDRLAHPVNGEAESVAALTPEDLRRYHASTVGPGKATLALAGHLDGIDVSDLAEEILGGWAGPEVPVPVPARTCGVRAEDATCTVVVDRPGSVQSELYVGCLGPDRSVEGGWAPYPVLGFVLGGGPQARLDAVLREEKGYTYGLRSGYRPRVKDGLFVTSGSVRAEVTAESLRIILDILGSARDGFSIAESQAGIDFVSRTAPSRYATADAVADEAAARALEGTTTAETTRTLQDMVTLTPERLADAYRRFATREWTIVVVGDAARFADGLESVTGSPVAVVPA